MSNELYIHTLRQLRDGCKAEHMDTETAALEAAIQALSCEGDCISRKAAINAAIDAINEWGGGWDAEREARDAINALPSVQIDGDCVSRQAAIDAVRCNYERILDFRSDGRTVADSVEDIISELPSAQPEPCEDAVSREAMRDEIDKLIKIHFDRSVVLTKAKQALFNLPSVTSKQRWIPCSERLPEKEGWYITTVESEKTGKRRIENDLFAIDIALAHGHIPNKFCKDGYRQRTVAWCEFPEPWRGEEHEADYRKE